MWRIASQVLKQQNDRMKAKMKQALREAKEAKERGEGGAHWRDEEKAKKLGPEKKKKKKKKKRKRKTKEKK